jgi:cytochrome P450
MEARVAISRFLKRFPNYRLNGEAQRTGRVRFRGFASLPVQVS